MSESSWSLIKKDIARHYHFLGKRSAPGFVDMAKGFANPRTVPVILCRISQSLAKHGLSLLAKVVSLVNFVLFGLEVALATRIAGGLYLPHTFGTVIGAERIGSNVTIYHGVTIGAKVMDLTFSPGARPVIGNDVVIGSGAKVLGGIVIGNNVVIGANAVVTRSVPDFAIVMGVPGRVIGFGGREGEPGATV